MRRKTMIIAEDVISTVAREYAELSEDEKKAVDANGGRLPGDLQTQYRAVMDPPARSFKEQVAELRATCVAELEKHGIPESEAGWCIAFPVVRENPLSDQWYTCRIVQACDQFTKENVGDRKYAWAAEIGFLSATRGFRLKHLGNVKTGVPVRKGAREGAAQRAKKLAPDTTARLAEMARLISDGHSVNGAAEALARTNLAHKASANLQLWKRHNK